jgi:aldehyde:ferredoxin oxidoreductase
MIEMMGNTMGGLTPDEAERRFGSKEVLVATSYKKAAAANFFQDVYTMADALEVCKFITAHNGHGITLGDMADMLYAVTGVRMDASGMREVANRIYTLERAFLVREGITKQDDFLRGKWVKGPVPTGPFAGHTIEEDQWRQMLEEYYETRGWDPKTGIPLRETLERLGLRDVASELETLGKLT